MGLNCTERTTNSIQVAVCKRNAFRPRYEHSVTRYSAAQNQFQTENQIGGLSIRSQTLSDFGLSLFGVVFCWSGFCVSQTNGSLSRAEFVFCFVLSGKWIAGRFWQHRVFVFDGECNSRIWDRSGFPDRDWVAF